MEKERFQKYLKDRYEDQVNWYSTKASKNKNYYYIFQWIVIVISAAIPVLVATLPKKLNLITIILSIILAIGTTALKTFKFQENWINYRTISETLKKERHFYDAELDAYSGASDKEALFVERVESLISRENSLWVTTHLNKNEEEKEK